MPKETTKQTSAKVSNSSAAFKTPPYSSEAERCLLGSLLIENNRWEEIGDVIVEEDFYFQEHQLIFRSLKQLADQGKAFDAVCLAERLQNNGDLEEAGKLEYLGELSMAVATGHNIRSYVEIVRDKSLLRKLIKEVSSIAEIAYEPGEMTGKDVIDTAESKIFSIAENGTQQGDLQRASGFVGNVIEQLERFYTKGSEVTGLSTSFYDLDQLTTGLHPGELIIVAGRPSMGKTSLAMNLVESTLVNDGKAALVFSMEMSADQIVTRMLSSIGQVSQQNLRTGKMTTSDWSKVNDVVGRLDKMHLYIDDSQSQSPSDLRTRSRRAKKQLPEGVELGIIMVDYLQLMTVGRHSYNQNRVAEISEITRNLKALAKEMRVPVVVLSQLNRSVESRDDKRPVMADLRESGSIEQDADLIMFIYRDEVYNKTSQEAGVAEIIIGKQRNGPIDTVKLGFEGKYTRFTNNTPTLADIPPIGEERMQTVGEYDG